MKKKWPTPQRPVRATLITFLILAGIFGATAPFMPDIPRLTYFVAGVGYSACLAILAVGIGLCGPRAGLFIKLIMLICLLVCLGMIIPLSYGQLTNNDTGAMAVFSVANQLGFLILCGLATAMILIATHGWKKYLHDGKAPNKFQEDTDASAPDPQK